MHRRGGLVGRPGAQPPSLIDRLALKIDPASILAPAHRLEHRAPGRGALEEASIDAAVPWRARAGLMSENDHLACNVNPTAQLRRRSLGDVSLKSTTESTPSAA
jgi:hypothetical protein